MMLISSLKIFTQQVRDCTLDILHGVPQEWLTWAPEGTSNHILWHAGHVLWVQDVLVLWPLTGEERLPAGWADKFGQYCQPVATTTEWPTRAEIVGLLQAQRDRVIEVLDEKADDLLTEPDRKTEPNGWPLLDGIIHGWHDEARHQGEMRLLYKMQAARNSY